MNPGQRARISEVVRYFLHLGLLGFGGPVALVGQMERELVTSRGWLTKEQMREAIAICQSLPGPLAIQVGIYLSYLRAGNWAAWAGGWAFILPNFIIVAALAAVYVRAGGLQWVIAALCLLVTVVLQTEVALLFVAAGIVGILYYGVLRGRPRTSATLSAISPLASHATASTLSKLGLFFLKAGALTFGSGLVIVPFLQQGVVRQYGWLSERDFLVAVAIGMISPGPVVITATFVGYLVAGFWGALIATIGIFLPSFILVQLAAPVLAAHRANRYIQGFVKGTYGAAIGTILGACVLLGKTAVGDWLTVLIAVASLVALFRWKLSNPMLMLLTAIIGIVAFPLLHPTWLMLK